MDSRTLSLHYGRAHDLMRNIDGLQPQEAFDELLKYMFFKQFNEERGPLVKLELVLAPNGSFGGVDKAAAQEIRQLFRQYLSEESPSWSNGLWPERDFKLSDAALVALHQLLGGIDFSSIPIDLRSAALKTFLTPELRRGLGIFLTPDEVAKMAVEVVAPQPTWRVYDPACGSGTFLIEVIRYLRSQGSAGDQIIEVWGTDLNPRMLLLAELNLGHYRNVVFHRRVFDAMSGIAPASWPLPNSFDLILTNPPFGVVIDGAHYPFELFDTCKDGMGAFKERQQSEVVFVEQSLKMLKPGGILGIVLPRSVITNSSLASARTAIDRLGYVQSVVSLPPETFATAGTQTTTSVLFFSKHCGRHLGENRVRVRHVNVRNVGYDGTGRVRSGSELPKVAPLIRCLSSNVEADSGVRVLPEVRDDETLSRLGDLLSGKGRSSDSIPLGDLAEIIATGRTPARSAYTDTGLFILKVGNLTGQGINWIPRDRNFVGGAEAEKRAANPNLMLRKMDILLTSSAHSRNYIAQKIDILVGVPACVGGRATYVGEIMLIRPRQEVVPPFVLLAYLRHPGTVDRLQAMVRGQTAHLMPADVAELRVPKVLAGEDEQARRLATLLEREAESAYQLNEISLEIESTLRSFALGG